MAVKIHFRGTTVAVEVGSGRTVLELAREADWHIEAKCGGRGSCASSSVLLGEGRYRVFSEEIEVLSDQRRQVLACQTRIIGDHAEIFIPNKSVISSEGARIADEMEIPDHPLNPRFNHGFGIAVNIGSTTVAWPDRSSSCWCRHSRSRRILYKCPWRSTTFKLSINFKGPPGRSKTSFSSVCIRSGRSARLDGNTYLSKTTLYSGRYDVDGNTNGAPHANLIS